MIFTDTENFFARASAEKLPSREEEKALAKRMKNGDCAARETLINGYLPMVASLVLRGPEEIRTLHTVYSCISELEAEVDTFNFMQEGESFVHHLSRRLRQCITKCLASTLSKNVNKL